MTANRTSIRLKTFGLPIGLAGAAAAALVVGAGFSESVVAKPSPDRTAAEVQSALAKGKIDRAISLAEQVVAANPREPSYRALLGHAYMKAGRFDSAATTFDDAMKLGDTSAKTALGLALSRTAQGRTREAVAILDDWRDAIPAEDLGLALALAGETGRGVAVLSDAVRAGSGSAKLRQNLAYAYALDGRWREARVMAEQDVPADLVDERISDWAARARPEDNQLRIAGLLSVPVRADSGQPTALALGDNPASEQLAVEAAATTVAPSLAAKGELPAASESSESLAQYRPIGAPVEAAPVAAAPAAVSAPQSFDSAFASQEAVSAPAKPKVVRTGKVFASHKPGLRPRQSRAKHAVGSSHRVQLGSFLSQQGARRAWGIYAAKNPELKNYKMTITTATVRGKLYYRVAAGGLNGKGASGLCSSVKSRGMACFAYAVNTRAAKAPVYARAAKPVIKTTVKSAPVVAARGAAGTVTARR